MTRGVHFAITEDQSRRLRDAADDDEVIAIIEEEIEESWDRAWLCETDKAWDAIHRCLGDGTLDGVSRSPMAFAILGGDPLTSSDDYIVRFVSPTTVAQVAVALAEVQEPWLRARYDGLTSSDYDGPHGEDDWAYVLENFRDLRTFYERAARAGRAVIFTAAQ